MINVLVSSPLKACQRQFNFKEINGSHFQFILLYECNRVMYKKNLKFELVGLTFINGIQGKKLL